MNGPFKTVFILPGIQNNERISDRVNKKHAALKLGGRL